MIENMSERDIYYYKKYLKYKKKYLNLVEQIGGNCPPNCTGEVVYAAGPGPSLQSRADAAARAAAIAGLYAVPHTKLPSLPPKNDYYRQNTSTQPTHVTTVPIYNVNTKKIINMDNNKTYSTISITNNKNYQLLNTGLKLCFKNKRITSILHFMMHEGEPKIRLDRPTDNIVNLNIINFDLSNQDMPIILRDCNESNRIGF